MPSCALAITDRSPLEPFKLRTTSLVLQTNLLVEKQDRYVNLDIWCICYLAFVCMSVCFVYMSL